MTRDEKLVDQARKQFKQCEDYEGQARTNFNADVKFALGDSYNGFQWPDGIKRFRESNDQPMLTINKTMVHCRQIINDARQNKTSISVRPVGGKASAEAASILEGVIRHIEYRSNAQQAYDAATWWMVVGGLGYIRVHVDYEDEDSFNQDIFIQRISNPLSVYLDPDIKEYDGSDARFAFVFDDMSRDEAKAKYPEYKDCFASAALDANDVWDNENHVRVCEWFTREEKADKLYLMRDGSTLRKGDLPDGVADDPMFAANVLAERETISQRITWRLLIGNKIADERPWLGKYIPIVRAVGEEVKVNDKVDRRGHVRGMIDPQRMYNYNSSGAVEAVALQSKAPWVVPLAGVTELEAYWSQANRSTLPYLPYKHADEAGNPIPPPTRQDPPRPAGGYMEGMQIAEHEMMMASGQYQAVLGAPSNETSGKAINARQRQGDNATYHFIDHLALAIRQVGRIILDLIPKVYDTARVVQVLGRDQKDTLAQLDPNGPPVQQVQDPDDDDFDPKRIAAIFNPNVGKYDVQSDVGPSYGTQRQETFNALTQLLTAHKELFPIIGDLWARAADFDGAEEIARRLAKKPDADPQVMQLRELAQQGAQEIEKLHGALTEAKQKLADQQRDLERKDYEAETNRMKAVGSIDPEALKPVLREVISQALGTHIGPLMDQHAAADLGRQPAPEPMEGQTADA